MWTHYDNLKVARNAPPTAIKAAYRTLSQQYHPDRNPAPDAERIIRLINKAYDVLGDPTRRTEYDRELEAQEKEERLAAQRRATAARKDDSSPATHAPRRSSPPPTPRPRPAPPPPTPSAAGAALPPAWVRVLLCAVLFAIGVWFSWREELNTATSHDAPEVANSSSPWATPAHDPSSEVAAPVSSSSAPASATVQPAVVPATVPPSVNPAALPAAANPTPALLAENPAPAQPPVRPPAYPSPIRPALSTPTPTDPDADFTAMVRKQVPDLDRLIHDPDWKTYMQWHEGTTTIGQIAKGAVARRDLKILVKIFDTFRLAKKTAISRGMSFSQLMEYEEQIIRTLPAHSTQ